MSDIKSFIADDKHLPHFMRDFHDQKDLFKAIHLTTGKEYVSWVEAHCYVIDRFLSFMAAHGYTLQRSRRNLPFARIEDSIQKCKDARTQSFARLLAAKEEGK